MMKKWMIAAVTAASIGLLTGCSSGSADTEPVQKQVETHAHSGNAAQPYAGLQTRAIKALAPERVSDLLEGKGAQYALAAELNHYPGPSHTLALATELGLTQDQEKQVRALNDSHKAEAKDLGKQLVDLETSLDQAFHAGQITEAELERLLREIGAVEANLRGIHLATHLKTQAILTSEQVRRYDQLRGYGN